MYTYKEGEEGYYGEFGSRSMFSRDHPYLQLTNKFLLTYLLIFPY